MAEVNMEFNRGDIMLRENVNGNFIGRYICIEVLDNHGVALWAHQGKAKDAIIWYGLFLTETGAWDMKDGRYMTPNGVYFKVEATNK